MTNKDENFGIRLAVNKDVRRRAFGDTLLAMTGMDNDFEREDHLLLAEMSSDISSNI